MKGREIYKTKLKEQNISRPTDSEMGLVVTEREECGRVGREGEGG